MEDEVTRCTGGGMWHEAVPIFALRDLMAAQTDDADGGRFCVTAGMSTRGRRESERDSVCVRGGGRGDGEDDISRSAAFRTSPAPARARRRASVTRSGAWPAGGRTMSAWSGLAWPRPPAASLLRPLFDLDLLPIPRPGLSLHNDITVFAAAASPPAIKRLLLPPGRALLRETGLGAVLGSSASSLSQS